MLLVDRASRVVMTVNKFGMSTPVFVDGSAQYFRAPRVARYCLGTRIVVFDDELRAPCLIVSGRPVYLFEPGPSPL